MTVIRQQAITMRSGFNRSEVVTFLRVTAEGHWEVAELKNTGCNQKKVTEDIVDIYGKVGIYWEYQLVREKVLPRVKGFFGFTVEELSSPAPFTGAVYSAEEWSKMRVLADYLTAKFVQPPAVAGVKPSPPVMDGTAKWKLAKIARVQRLNNAAFAKGQSEEWYRQATYIRDYYRYKDDPLPFLKRKFAGKWKFLSPGEALNAVPGEIRFTAQVLLGDPPPRESRKGVWADWQVSYLPIKGLR